MTGSKFSLIFALSLAALASKPSELQALRTQIKQILHIPEPLPELRDKTYGQFPVAPEVAADRVSYATGYQLRVPAIVYHSAGATVIRHPALVVVNGNDVNGNGGDKSSQYAYWAGVLYARAGAVVLTYDSVGQYERNSDRQSGYKLVVPENMASQITSLMIIDVMQAVEYLRSRKDVDPQSIAVLAFSAGSFIGSLTCAVDMNIHACVIAGSGTPSDNEALQSAVYKSLSFLGDQPAALSTLSAKRGPTLTSHVSDAPDFLSRPAALWLHEKLKFPNWTKKQILAMPEKDINGLMVIGDVPQVPREDLHALPTPVWNAEKGSYVYESWLERAKSTLTQR